MSAATPPLLIAAAVEQEIQGLRKALDAQRPLSPLHANALQGRWRDSTAILVRTGVGPKRARERLTPLLREVPCRGIVSTGYAGGLRHECKLGDILVPEAIQSIPPLAEGCFRPDPDLRERVLEGAGRGPWRVHTGRMITTDHVVFAREEKQKLGDTYDAAGVEMESAVIAEIADEAAVPFVVVRVVLDEASFTLPDMMEVFRWYRKKEYGKLIPFVVSRPRKLAELLGLLLRSRKATKTLNGLFVDSLLDVLGEVEPCKISKRPVQQ